MQMWLQIILRSTSLFLLTFILVRLMGKRNMAQITPFRFVGYLVIALIAAAISANIITDLIAGFVALGVCFFFFIILDFLSLKSKSFHDFVNGKETVLIKHGKIMEENLSQTRLTGQELLSALRSKNAFSLADVEFALMESTGDINVFLKSDKKPVTAHDLGTKTAPHTEPQTVILDGKVLNEPLSSLGLNKEWLRTQLEATGVSLDNVFIGQVDSTGELCLDLFDDSVKLPQPKVKEMIYATMEKTHASLMSFALETEDEKAKDMYARDAEKLKQLLVNLEPYLLR